MTTTHFKATGVVITADKVTIQSIESNYKGDLNALIRSLPAVISSLLTAITAVIPNK